MSQPDANLVNNERNERLQLIDTMKAPIIQIGKTAGYEVIEN